MQIICSSPLSHFLGSCLSFLVLEGTFGSAQGLLLWDLGVCLGCLEIRPRLAVCKPATVTQIPFLRFDAKFVLPTFYLLFHNKMFCICREPLLLLLTFFVCGAGDPVSCICKTGALPLSHIPSPIDVRIAFCFTFPQGELC